jgi:uncharacterized protein (TIGR00730 family)
MELHFSRTNGPADEAIDQLMALVDGVHHPEIVREMILAALKAGQEGEERADLKLMNSTLKEMRFTSKVFTPYRHRTKVTVFGSARTGSEEPLYAMARRFGQRLREADYMVITGAGPGIMAAVNEGAGPDHSFGVNIRLPFEQRANPTLEGSPRHIMYKYFFNRKVAFLKEADAVALFPGGFGTLDEAMETLTLVQTGKRAPLPIILFEEPGGTYWEEWIAFIRKELLARGYVSPPDLSLFERVNSDETALAIICRFYKRYQSLRYVNGKLVIRLLTPLRSQELAQLRREFSDILLEGGEITPSGPLAREADEPEIAHLPRLLVDFNRRDFARLKSLIDALNSF